MPDHMTIPAAEIMQQHRPLEQHGELEQHRPLEQHRRLEQHGPLQQRRQQHRHLQQHEHLQQVEENAGRKAKPQNLQEQIERAKAKRRRAAEQADKRTVFVDKMRHGFYTAVKGVVNGWKAFTRQNREKKRVTENSRDLQSAFDDAIAHIEDLPLDYVHRVTKEYAIAKYEFEEQWRGQNLLAEGEEFEEAQSRYLQERQFAIEFGAQQRADVVGGTKPIAVQYAGDGSKWLVKESVSCIGIDAPSAATVTEAGYKIQNLVNPATAVEAFRGKSVGKGVVSYQRMVKDVKRPGDEGFVDLFRFSRTPEAMTDEELLRITELSPQLLREHTTDWLLCNFDANGENFIITGNDGAPDTVYGIDKEAAFRPILDEGAQHMDKDYCRFDQNTVYNRLFQKFADGSMDLDLQQVLPQIQKVEAMGDAEYMKIFDAFLLQKKQEYAQKPEVYQKIYDNILQRKQTLRMEYRDFFSKLVEERCQNLSPEGAAQLRRQYFGSEDGRTFIFTNETAQQLKQERERRITLRQQDQEEQKRREQQAEKADKADERSYKRRHAFYDFSKALVMGSKRISDAFKRRQAEQRTTTIPLSQVRLANMSKEYADRYTRRVLEILQDAQTEEDLHRLMETETIELSMVRDEEIHLGGTKPMSQYIASDGSQWLAKQAVNCMGYYKKEGALLTAAGAQLQKLVDPATAVDAFVGRTDKHGEVSFQRRLENVEHGEGKLDLFRFSRHPEIASQDTIAAVQELAPQILREHTTDWLLCNFDTKGENFIITNDGQGRVLHGIDKEAAFNKILNPKAQKMSMTYRTHANETLYNVIFQMYANNDMDFDLMDVLPQIERIERLDDEAYMATYRDYLEHIQAKDPEHFEEIREKILQRKKDLRLEYESFFTDLVTERCKKLHPDEAADLKRRYFGEGGQRFRFPAA